ncbi:PIG-L family deacetylase [Hymenobacter jeollabukensis]|uniref:LmbE family protein n=1 Tax=Hymenobacter jeollabukensis TaxID=2025313 RepID=A0A5R8WKZ5_9BACT|nr:PIG-L family deacetylase [Hymenobacter jeollabukensis]TLM89514.1 LmbE family protein [Hymenobacter jeollabukensis]
MLRRLLRAALPAIIITHSLIHAFTAEAQAPKTYSSSEILLGLKKLNVLGSVLYIAAHPDDENTRLIAYLANGRLVETGYFSCTRGDGGQNLIGPELREQLGVIRTQELLAARRIDGGRQFFSRANDFGFSKTPEETFKIWDREQVLADMVWVIRQRRPDVLITRFPPDARAGHGHHTASAILAAEAFDAAGDPKRFPEQLPYVQPWQPKRLFWNTGSFFVKPGESMDGYLKLDAGGYNPLLGQSYGEIAARSRSQHRSQGFGSAAQRGEALEYLQLVKGDKATKDPLEGVDLSWNRVKGGAAVQKLLDEVIRKFDPSNPAASVPGLLKVRSGLGKVEPNNRFWAAEKGEELNALIQACYGLRVEAIATEPSVTPGGNLQVKIDAVSLNGFSLTGLYFNWSVNDSTLYQPPLPPGKVRTDGPLDMEVQAGPNKLYSKTVTLRVPPSQALSQPYWLREQGSVGMYKLPNVYEVEPAQFRGYMSYYKAKVAPEDLVGLPENPPAAYVYVQKGEDYGVLRIKVPIQYKRTDPALGELYQPLAVVPPVAVNVLGKAYVFADEQAKMVPVTLKAGRAGAKGSVALQVPAGWQVLPASIAFDIANKDEERTVTFLVQPVKNSPESSGQLRAVATLDGQPYSRGIQTINYPHIPTQTLFPEAVAPLVRLDVKRRKEEIGYLMGAGDEVPEALRQLGYRVTLLKPEDLTADKLKRFDAVMLGVRAYNTIDRLKYQQKELLEYVEKGGNLVVQYTVNRGTVLPEIGPYPLQLSNDRVTVEDAPVTITRPQHPLMSLPNKITPKDFEGWQQEQGLYYPSSWDPKYQTVISSQDPGEKPKESAILVTDYGKGHYIYTGLSFFRELPAGVPGAYRLITNMIELGKDKAN